MAVKKKKQKVKGYPLVHICNSTNYPATGTVSYLSQLCSDDDYSVGAWDSWQANNRGVCLVNEISATLTVGGNQIKATSYTSSGTSYSQFAIIQTAPGVFVVTRITSD